MTGEQEVPKIGSELLQRIDAAGEDATFDLLVQYKEPEIAEGIATDARVDIYREQTRRQTGFYRDNGIVHDAYEMTGAIRALLKRRHVYDLLKNDDVSALVESDFPLPLIE